MQIELNGENGLNLYAETKEGYEIYIKLGHDNRPYTDFDIMALHLYQYFNIDKDYPIEIQDNDGNAIAIIHDKN